jgi:hypothetical protein
VTQVTVRPLRLCHPSSWKSSGEHSGEFETWSFGKFHCVSAERERTRRKTQALLSAIGVGLYVGALWRAGLSGPALWAVASIRVAALISGIAGFACSAISRAILFQFRRDSIGVVETLLSLYRDRNRSTYRPGSCYSNSAVGPVIFGHFLDFSCQSCASGHDVKSAGRSQSDFLSRPWSVRYKRLAQRTS